MTKGLRIREGRLSTFIVPKEMGTYRTDNMNRVRDSEVTVFALIERKPMIKSADIYTAVGLTKMSVLTAIRRLYKRGAIVSWSGANIDGKGSTLYLKVADGWDSKRLGVLKAQGDSYPKSFIPVLEALSAEPITLEAIVAQTGEARTTVWRCLNCLIKDGIVTKDTFHDGTHSGRPVTYYRREAAERL